MISSALCLLAGVVIGGSIIGILAGGKCKDLQGQIDSGKQAKTLECSECERIKCSNCYEVRQLKKSNAALRGDNKRMYRIEHGNKGNSRVLYDLWAAQNKVSAGE